MSNLEINKIKTFIKNIFASDDTILNNLKKIEIDNSITEITEIIDFVIQNSKRGICTLENE